MSPIFTRLIAFLLVMLPLFNLSAADVAPYFRYQDDADIQNWAYESVQEMRKAHIMEGFQDETFRPKDLVTRAEALIILFKLYGVEESAVDLNVLDNFTDVKKNKWYAQPFAKAITEQWIEGYQDKTLRPHAPVTRAEWAALISKAYELSPSTEKVPYFTDVETDDWYYNPVASLYRHDLLFNKNVYDFLPKSFLTRQEVAWQAYAVWKKKQLLVDRLNANEALTKNKIQRDYSLSIKNSDFIDLQGTTLQKQALMLDMVSSKPQTITVGDVYTEVGILKIVNPFDTEVSLDTLGFNLFIPGTNIGPMHHFEFQMDLDGQIFNQTFDRSGKIVWSQLSTVIAPNSEMNIVLRVKAGTDKVFLPGIGTLIISVDQVDSMYEDEYSADGKNIRAGDSVQKFTPIQMENISLRPIEFRPR